MKRGVKQVFGVAGVALLASGALASTPDSKDAPGVKRGAVNGQKLPTPPDEETADALDSAPTTDPEKPVNDSPYAAIVERNIFALVPPPPAPSATNDDIPNTPPVNVTLTGITTIFGNKRALFLVQEPPPAGKPPTAPDSYMLTEGERRGKLEVVEIDVKAGTVKIKNDSVVSTITFPKTTPAASGAPGPGGSPPGFPGRRGGFTPPGVPGAPGTPPGIPSRTMRSGSGGGGPGISQNQNNYSPYGGGQNGYTPSSTGYSNPGIQYVNPGSAGASAPAVAVNSGAPGLTSSQPAVAPQPQQPALSPEEQTVMIEAQRAYAHQQNDPIAIILPPTEISEEEGGTGAPPAIPR